MIQETLGRELEILVVEDNEADVRLIKEGLAEVNVRFRLNVVEDGEEAGDFLFQRGKYASAPRPDLVLLDLNLPRRSGTEVLESIKTDANLKRIPVVVLTSSKSARDVNTCYDRGANTYFRKPSDLDQIYDLFRTLEHYWLTLAVLPATPQEA